MYNPYQYNQQQNFMQPWMQQNQFQSQNQWQQPAMPAQPAQPELQQLPVMPPTSDIAQAIHRLCDILEAKMGGQNHV